MEFCPICRASLPLNGVDSCPRCKRHLSCFTDANRWQGQVGRLLILGSDSYGDSFERSRHLTQLKADWRVVLLDGLVPLFRGNFPSDRIYSYLESLPEFDYWTDLLDGFRSFGRPPAPNFVAPTEAVQKYSHIPHPSIGVCFRAAEKYEPTKHRSLQITDISKIVSGLPGFHWISLQPGIDIPCGVNTRFESWSDTAGLISNLDAVLTVDSAIAHLSALLCKPTVVLFGRAATSVTRYPKFSELYPGQPIRGIQPEYGGSFPPSAPERFVSWVKRNPEFWKPHNFWQQL